MINRHSVSTLLANELEVADTFFATFCEHGFHLQGFKWRAIAKCSSFYFENTVSTQVPVDVSDKTQSYYLQLPIILDLVTIFFIYLAVCLGLAWKMDNWHSLYSPLYLLYQSINNLNFQCTKKP